MYKFKQIISRIDTAELLTDKVFLWIFSPSQKSPHVGISVNGSYYSLQLNGKQENYPVKKIITTIGRKQMEVLFVEINTGTTIEQLENTFGDYASCQKNACSCTAPLFELFGVVKDKAILFDLLDKLKSENRIEAVYQTNISDQFEGIPQYSFADVQDNLLQLSH